MRSRWPPSFPPRRSAAGATELVMPDRPLVPTRRIGRRARRPAREAAWQAAQEALRRCGELIEDGDLRQAVRLGRLRRAGRQGRSARAGGPDRQRAPGPAGEAQAELIVPGDQELPRGHWGMGPPRRLAARAAGLRPAARTTLGALLRRAEAGEPLVAPPGGEEARAEVRRQLSSELGGGPFLLASRDGRARSARRM